MRKFLLLVAAVALLLVAGLVYLPKSDQPIIPNARAAINGHEFDDILNQPVAKKSRQLNFLIVIADGPGSGIVEGPMSRIHADAEMKLYVDADATLMVEDGHGGYIDVKSRQPMQDLLAARDPDWNK